MQLKGITINNQNGIEVITIEGFADIFDTQELSQSFLKMLHKSFEHKGPYKDIFSQKQDFSGKKIYHYEDDIKMFEYDSMEKLQADLKNWKSKFKKISDLTVEKIDNRQVLEASGYFEYNGKFYLLGLLYADENKEDNNESIGVLNGVIVNFELYSGISAETQEEVDVNSGKINEILKKYFKSRF